MGSLQPRHVRRTIQRSVSVRATPCTGLIDEKINVRPSGVMYGSMSVNVPENGATSAGAQPPGRQCEVTIDDSRVNGQKPSLTVQNAWRRLGENDIRHSYLSVENSPSPNFSTGAHSPEEGRRASSCAPAAASVVSCPSVAADAEASSPAIAAVNARAFSCARVM